MTMNVALGLAPAPPRSGDRGHRDTGAETGNAFDDLVRGADPKQGRTEKGRSRDTRVDHDGGRPLDYYAARLGVRTASTADEAADAGMEIVLDDILAKDAALTEPVIEELPDAGLETDAPAEQVALPVSSQTTALPVPDGRLADAEDAARAADGRPTAMPDDGKGRAANDSGKLQSTAATPPARSVATPDAGRTPAEPMPRDGRAEGPRGTPADGAAPGNPRTGGERSTQPAAPQLSATPDSSGEAGRDGAKPAVSSSAGEASRPAGNSAFDQPASRPSSPGERNAAQLAAKVNVLGFSAAVAPAPVAMLGATSAGLVAAIEADPTWRAAAAEPAPGTARTPNFASGVNTLRIQLHPAEFGMVTARLTAVGSQLEIEIRVESNDARQRLANDSDAIVKALRAAGLDVEKVTIQQGNTSSANANQSGAGARDQHLAGQQMQSDEHGRDRGNRQPGTGEGEDAAAGSPTDVAAHRAHGDVYI